jgi:hypothetical protein
LPKLPQVEDFVCKQGDEAAHDAMSKRIESATWIQEQVRMLRTLGMQVADKDAALVLVEMHNRGLFAAGLLLVGTLAYMAWLNEFGVHALSVPRTSTWRGGTRSSWRRRCLSWRSCKRPDWTSLRSREACLLLRRPPRSSDLAEKVCGWTS